MGPVAWSGVSAEGQDCAAAAAGAASVASSAPIILIVPRMWCSPMGHSPFRLVDFRLAVLGAALASFACTPRQEAAEAPPQEPALELTVGTPVQGDAREVHLKNIRQLTYD